MSAQSRQSGPARLLSLRGRDRQAPPPTRSADRFAAWVDDASTSVVVTAVGELDLVTAEEFDHVLWGAQRRARWVVVDLRALSFIDCAGIRSLLGGQLRASSWRRHLEVSCTDGQVRRLLALTGVDALVTVVTEPAGAPHTQRDGTLGAHSADAR